jgi:UDP-3-O-[3-hydroxymyristoyl] glucosamine N-acyltransferase
MILLGAKSPLIVELEETCARSAEKVSAIVGFCDNRRVLEPNLVISPDEIDPMVHGYDFIPCAFAPQRRRELVQYATHKGLKLAAPLLDPTSIRAGSCQIGNGVYVNAAAVIGALTLVRKAAFINRSASIGHHCVIGAYASLGPGCVLASNVTVEDDVIIGAGAVIMPDIHIGQGAVISAGATVSKNVPDGALVSTAKTNVIEDGARRIALRRGDQE